MEKYPDQAMRIKKALELDESEIMKKKEHEMSIDEVRIYRAQLQKEKAQKVYKDNKAQRVTNISYEKQRGIQKKLLTPMGEESENESEAEGDQQNQRTSLTSPIITQSGDQQRE